MGRLALQSVRLPALVYLATTLLCTQLPLLNSLGYEFSAVIALLATFSAGFSTIRRVKESFHENTTPQVNAFNHTLISNLLLLLIPLILISLNAFFVKNCSWLEGLGFYLLIPVVTVVFSTALGFFCAVHYRKAKTVFVLIVLVTFGEVFAVGYCTPAIFSYNFFYGFFPGVTYDEALGIGASLVLFRTLTLMLAAVLVWMTNLLLKHTKHSDTTWEKGVALLGAMVQGRSAIISAAVATVIIVTWWFRGELGFDSTSGFIRQQLGAHIVTPHFVIFYSRDSYDDDEIQWIAAEHEFRLAQINNVLSFPSREKIESYIYPSSEIKQRLMGAGNTNIAKPWSGQLHLSKQSLDATLKHELVHVVAAHFGLPIIKASLSTGLVEGLAEAIDWNFGTRTPHQYAAALHKAGAAPDIRSLMLFTGFASQASSVSYVLAGSFCRYLIDTYGIRQMMLLYRTNDYHAQYNKSLDDLIAEWKAFLATVQVTEHDLTAVDALFRRPPLFKKVCARVVAARNIEARRFLNERSYAAATQLFAQSYDETRSYESLSGMLTSALRLGQYDAVTAAFDTLIANDQRPNQFLPLFLTAGDALWARGKTREAQSLYRRLADANVSEGFTEAALIRWHAVQDSARGTAFRKYFLSDTNDTLRLALLDSAFAEQRSSVAQYLKARILQRCERHNEAVRTFGSFRFESTDSTLESLRWQRLGYSLFRLSRFEEARAAFWYSLNHIATEAAHNEVNEWLDRCTWMGETWR
jgi:tetratricopeptide (TPR) repeat protein